MRSLARAFAMIAAVIVREQLEQGTALDIAEVSAAFDAGNRAAYVEVALQGKSIPCARTLSGWCAVVEVDGGMVTLHDHLEHDGATKQRAVTCAKCLQVFDLSV
jgi:hypothetical protein